MSLRARIARLQRDMEWMRWWGRLRVIEKKLAMIEIQKRMEAARRVPPPVPKAKPVARQEEGVRVVPPPEPPPGPRPVPGPAPAPAPSLDPVYQPYDPPEHMQIRPVQWRPGGPVVDDEDDMRGRVLVDYDPIDDDPFDDDSS